MKDKKIKHVLASAPTPRHLKRLFAKRGIEMSEAAARALHEGAKRERIETIEELVQPIEGVPNEVASTLREELVTAEDFVSLLAEILILLDDDDGDDPRDTPPATPTGEEMDPEGCTRRALVVGINSYPGAAALQNCVRDALAIREKLVTVYKFDPKNVAILLEDNATKDAILTGARNLVADLEAGDAAFFFYAGHGTQRADTNFDEPDYLDEAIVPFDAVSASGSTVAGKLLIDDELRAIFEPVDINVNLAVMFDACHSATATRGPTIRGLAPSLHTQALAAAGLLLPPRSSSVVSASNKHVMMSACRTTETALDGAVGGNGLFTTQVLRAMREDQTYAELHALVAPAVARVAQASSHSQHPQIEGANAGRKIGQCLESTTRWF